jgi:hypothetical protein
MVAGTQLGQTTETLTNKTIDADDNTLQDLTWSIDGYKIKSTNMDYYLGGATLNTYTITGDSCIVTDGTSFDMTVSECDSSGANCAAVETALTCDTNGAVIDVSPDVVVEAGNYVFISFANEVGEVSDVSYSIYCKGDQ